MKVSILLHIQNNLEYVNSFFQSILKQTAAISELVIVLENSSHEAKALADEMQEIAPFEVQIIHQKPVEDFKVFKTALAITNGEIILFAKPEHSFLPKKVADYKRFVEKDPYFRLIFTNSEVIDENDELGVNDYLGITGFYERWDYYRDLAIVLTKTKGFVPDFQLGITNKTAEEILQFYNDFPTYSSNLTFSDLVSILVGMNAPDTIKEIPYVLTKYRMSKEDIVDLKQNGRDLPFSLDERIRWLNDYKNVALIINQNHHVIPQLDKVISFLSDREKIQKKGILNRIGFGIFNLNRYLRLSAQSLDDLKVDIFK